MAICKSTGKSINVDHTGTIKNLSTVLSWESLKGKKKMKKKEEKIRWKHLSAYTIIRSIDKCISKVLRRWNE